MNMKKMICLLLSVVMLLSMAACGGKTTPIEPPEQTENVKVTEPTPEVDNLATFISVSYSPNWDESNYLMAYTNEDGTAYVEYSSNGRKVATMDVSVLNTITVALQTSGILELDGRMEWVDGEASGSFSVSFADETYASADFGGVVPEEFIACYKALEECFQTLMADVPEYVPSVQIMGEMDPEEQAALLEILNNSGMEGLDMLTIAEIPMDEYFAMTARLSGTEGVVSGSTCAPMMMTTAFALTVVTVDGDREAVCADFEGNINWREWVCVAPSNAMIATKDDMVLCLLASDMMYELTAASIEAAGWNVYVALENPDM